MFCKSVLVTITLITGSYSSAQSSTSKPGAKESPIVEVCISGNAKALEQLLNSGSDVNSTNTAGQTLLEVACQNGHVAVVNLLIGRGADINHVYKNVTTPLITSIYFKHPEISILLLEKGANPNPQKLSYWGPLMEAVYRNQNSVVIELLKHGADPNPKSGEGTALNWAVRGNNRELVLALLAHKADPNVLDENGYPALGEICSDPSGDLAEILIKNGANPNLEVSILGTTTTAMTALFLFSNPDQWKSIKHNWEVLLRNGANPNLPKSGGPTPLFIVASNGLDDGVKLLLSKGADPTIKFKGLSPLEAALKGGFSDVAKSLQSPQNK